MLTNIEAIHKLENLRNQINNLHNYNEDSPIFSEWRRNVEIAIENIFGVNTRHLSDFRKIQYSPTIIVFSTDDDYDNSDYSYRESFISGLMTAKSLFNSLIQEIKEYRKDMIEVKHNNPKELIERLINRFHLVSRQLKSRHSDRNTLEINDEYDVQDLFHGLLKLYFDDIRAEEWTPSYACAASRTDFLLKNEKIIIEIKKTRKSLKSKELGEQLIVDSMRYEAHPDCKTLICFIYDPEGIITNPKGIENDLTKNSNGLQIYTYIRPE